MDIVNQKLNRSQFTSYANSKNYGSLPPNKLVIHHTWSPSKEEWNGQNTVLGLKHYYEGLGWSAGPHLFVAEDGIWLFSDMSRDGIHAGSGNHLSIGIEVVGDYDNQVWCGETKTNTLHSINTLLKKLNIPDSEIHFHRDYSKKSCPGNAITKQWVLTELTKYRQQIGEATVASTDNIVKEGDLVKTPTNPKVYLIQDNKKRHIENELAFWILTDREFKNVKTVANTVLDNVTEGDTIKVNDFEPSLLRVIKQMSNLYNANPNYAKILFATIK
ncbi:MAG: hypothetical protein A2507_00915 [Candidatus Magasanikbacteria bacterium RIFOXYD12_FULL_33_17]|nr:MAG: hypothetical protein A2507_00915 [Candidatus Magasanikbacteria bacterium RIFOXYD12_FULL_33_17]